MVSKISLLGIILIIAGAVMYYFGVPIMYSAGVGGLGAVILVIKIWGFLNKPRTVMRSKKVDGRWVKY
jgi:uncharacterized membrane protein